MPSSVRRVTTPLAIVPEPGAFLPPDSGPRPPFAVSPFRRRGAPPRSPPRPPATQPLSGGSRELGPPLRDPYASSRDAGRPEDRDMSPRRLVPPTAPTVDRDRELQWLRSRLAEADIVSEEHGRERRRLAGALSRERAAREAAEREAAAARAAEEERQSAAAELNARAESGVRMRRELMATSAKLRDAQEELAKLRDEAARRARVQMQAALNSLFGSTTRGRRATILHFWLDWARKEREERERSELLSRTFQEQQGCKVAMLAAMVGGSHRAMRSLRFTQWRTWLAARAEARRAAEDAKAEEQKKHRDTTLSMLLGNCSRSTMLLCFRGWMTEATNRGRQRRAVERVRRDSAAMLHQMQLRSQAKLGALTTLMANGGERSLLRLRYLQWQTGAQKQRMMRKARQELVTAELTRLRQELAKASDEAKGAAEQCRVAVDSEQQRWAAERDQFAARLAQAERDLREERQRCAGLSAEVARQKQELQGADDALSSAAAASAASAREAADLEQRLGALLTEQTAEREQWAAEQDRLQSTAAQAAARAAHAVQAADQAREEAQEAQARLGGVCAEAEGLRARVAELEVASAALQEEVERCTVGQRAASKESQDHAEALRREQAELARAQGQLYLTTERLQQALSDQMGLLTATADAERGWLLRGEENHRQVIAVLGEMSYESASWCTHQRRLCDEMAARCAGRPAPADLAVSPRSASQPCEAGVRLPDGRVVALDPTGRPYAAGDGRVVVYGPQGGLYLQDGGAVLTVADGLPLMWDEGCVAFLPPGAAPAPPWLEGRPRLPDGRAVLCDSDSGGPLSAHDGRLAVAAHDGMAQLSDGSAVVRGSDGGPVVWPGGIVAAICAHSGAVIGPGGHAVLSHDGSVLTADAQGVLYTSGGDAVWLSVDARGQPMLTPRDTAQPVARCVPLQALLRGSAASPRSRLGEWMLPDGRRLNHTADGHLRLAGARVLFTTDSGAPLRPHSGGVVVCHPGQNPTLEDGTPVLMGADRRVVIWPGGGVAVVSGGTCIGPGGAQLPLRVTEGGSGGTVATADGQPVWACAAAGGGCSLARRRCGGIAPRPGGPDLRCTPSGEPVIEDGRAAVLRPDGSLISAGDGLLVVRGATGRPELADGTPCIVRADGRVAVWASGTLTALGRLGIRAAAPLQEDDRESTQPRVRQGTFSQDQLCSPSPRPCSPPLSALVSPRRHGTNPSGGAADQLTSPVDPRELRRRRISMVALTREQLAEIIATSEQRHLHELRQLQSRLLQNGEQLKRQSQHVAALQRRADAAEGSMRFAQSQEDLVRQQLRAKDSAAATAQAEAEARAAAAAAAAADAAAAAEAAAARAPVSPRSPAAAGAVSLSAARAVLRLSKLWHFTRHHRHYLRSYCWGLWRCWLLWQRRPAALEGSPAEEAAVVTAVRRELAPAVAAAGREGEAPRQARSPRHQQPSGTLSTAAAVVLEAAELIRHGPSAALQAEAERLRVEIGWKNRRIMLLEDTAAASQRPAAACGAGSFPRARRAGSPPRSSRSPPPGSRSPPRPAAPGRPQQR
eukprot:TRINITY_DN1338_c0_g1_i1.p1 TRINITY_DN1338_c0_g1~~TRINITY_DN1338_c0_g1_i1.p1  ORF type:complete len:1567 (+),score=404.07 TRINITY_DN1338_c0_g1_i1:80-4702(+)